MNTSKINKFVPENRRVRNDWAFSYQIFKLLCGLGERMKVAILLLALSGIRLGALSSLRMKYLEGGSRKLLVYENDKAKYFFFTTPECNNALDSYLDMGSCHGVKINNELYLLKEQFDVREPFQAKNPRRVNTDTMRWKLIVPGKSIGVRSKDV